MAKIYQITMKYTKMAKIYQIIMKYTKMAEKDQMAIKYVDQNLPLLVPQKFTQIMIFAFENMPSGNPGLNPWKVKNIAEKK
jgi:hypothetical protein